MVLLPRLRLISQPNGTAPTTGWGSTCHIYGITRLRDQYMLALKKIALGNATQSRTAVAVFAATLLFGGGVTEASAKTHRHHHHHHHHHYGHRHFHHASAGGSWRDANASIAPLSGFGRIFSGMASFYGNESGQQDRLGPALQSKRHDLRPSLAAVRDPTARDPWRSQRGRHRQ